MPKRADFEPKRYFLPDGVQIAINLSPTQIPVWEKLLGGINDKPIKVETLGTAPATFYATVAKANGALHPFGWDIAQEALRGGLFGYKLYHIEAITNIPNRQDISTDAAKRLLAMAAEVKNPDLEGFAQWCAGLFIKDNLPPWVELSNFTSIAHELVTRARGQKGFAGLINSIIDCTHLAPIPLEESTQPLMLNRYSSLALLCILQTHSDITYSSSPNFWVHRILPERLVNTTAENIGVHAPLASLMKTTI